IAAGPVADLIEATRGATVRVRSPRATELADALTREDATVMAVEPGLLEVRGLTAARVGDAAASAGLALHELVTVRASLEDAYMTLTQDEVEYRSEDTAQEGALR
ncbi:ABC transporter ATP-binding protein, partial [Georgenia sp. 10Sc9-8]|nr:ABC transporter ATP-binding protein [Georgenia halotolerans]